MAEDPPSGALVFVYGTLREGFRNPGRDILERHARFLDVARVRGVLYDAGAFPVLALDGPGVAVGEVYELSQPGVALERLDRYEGARGDQPAPYERVKRPAVLAGKGRVEEVWLYGWKGSVEGMDRVPWGDYVAFLERLNSKQ